MRTAIAAVVAGVLLFFTAAGASAQTQVTPVTVSAWIDYDSDLVITPYQIFWDHHGGAQPGLWGANYPTTVAGYDWYPEWDGSNRTPGLSSALDVDAVFGPLVWLQVNSARGPVDIIQYPNEENDYTMIIHLFDGPSGATWYNFTIYGLTLSVYPPASPFCPVDATIDEGNAVPNGMLKNLNYENPIVGSVGDQNRDGQNDFLTVSKDFEGRGYSGAGKYHISIRSGRDGSLLKPKVIVPSANNDTQLDATYLRVSFAEGLRTDFNGDGIEDFAIGTRCGTPGNCCRNKGSLVVYSGATGVPMYEFSPQVGCAGFYASAGDVTGDGHPDLVVGDPAENRVVIIPGKNQGFDPANMIAINPNTSPKYGTLFTGASFNFFVETVHSNGSPMVAFGSTITVLQYHPKAGTQWAPPTIIAADPRHPALAGAHATQDAGMWVAIRPPAYSTNAPDQADLFKVVPSIDVGYLGYQAENLGDLDNDGYDDFAMSAPASVSSLASTGSVTVYSGRTLKPLRFPLRQTGDSSSTDLEGNTADALFGYSLSGAADVNGDGDSDFAVASPGDEGGVGMVRVYSGATGGMLYELNGDQLGIRGLARFGQGVAMLGHGRMVVADRRGDFRLIGLGPDANQNAVADRCEGRVVMNMDTTDAINQIHEISGDLLFVLKSIKPLVNNKDLPTSVLALINLQGPSCSAGNRNPALDPTSPSFRPELCVPSSQTTQRQTVKFQKTEMTATKKWISDKTATLVSLLTSNQPALANYHEFLSASQATKLQARLKTLMGTTGAKLVAASGKMSKIVNQLQIGSSLKTP